MDFTDFQFGNLDPEFDLSLDITGSNYQKPVFEELPETGLPENFWFQNSSGTPLVTNNELPGKVDDKFSDTIKSNENRQVINKAHLMAMRGVSALELESTLKLSFSRNDFSNSPFLRFNLFLLPLVGPVFWECWPYKSEEESKIELRRRKSIKPVFTQECSKCGSCHFRSSLPPQKMFCSKLGLESKRSTNGYQRVSPDSSSIHAAIGFKFQFFEG
jgi:hypothetical protein